MQQIIWTQNYKITTCLQKNFRKVRLKRKASQANKQTKKQTNKRNNQHKKWYPPNPTCQTTNSLS